MPASLKAQALSNARKEALRKQLGYPEGFDMDANREAVIQEYQRIHTTRNWTDHNGTPLTLRSTARCTYLQFEKRSEKKKAPPRPKAGEGTAKEEDAMKHLTPFLDLPISQLDLRYFGDDEEIEAELNAFREENKDVTLRRMLEYGGDAFDGDFRVFLRVCKLINKATGGRECCGVPEEALKPFLEKQKAPPLVPLESYDIQNPKNAVVKKEIVNASLFLVLDSVAARNELRKRPCHSERICHMMAKTAEVVMAKPFRGRTLWQAEKYAFFTQGSKALASVSKGPLEPEDKIECWLGIHGAKYFRAPTEAEHAEFVKASTRKKKSAADTKPAPKQKKLKAVKREAGALG